MPDILLLNDIAAFPEETLITQALQGRWPIHRVKSLEALKERRSVAGEVVVTAVPAEKAMLLTTQIKAVLPNATVVNILEAEDTAISPLTAECLFVQRPLTEFTTQSVLAAALRLCELSANLEECAHLDEVTSLFNRQYFMKRLGEEISLCRRHLAPLSVVVIGISQYQLHLDSYGYEFVNAMLLQAAAIIQKHIRQEDLVARVGDDEIALLLPRSSEKGAKVLANRIVLSLNSTPFKFDAYNEELEAHAGIAGFPLRDNTPAHADTLIRYARHALHNARCADEETSTVKLFSEIQPAL